MVEPGQFVSSLHPFVKVTRTINRPANEIFDKIMQVDLTRIFPPQGEAPGIASSSITADWGRPGQERVNTSTDGSTNREVFMSVEPGKSFSYKVFDFTAPALKDLVQEIHGAWWFEDNQNGTTSIIWIYALVPKTEDAKAQIEKRLLTRYQNRLENAMSILKADMEQ